MAQALAILGAAGGVAGGVEAFRASREEASELRAEGEIVRGESEQAAQDRAIENRKFVADQKLTFLKNGITLEGSPLLVLKETKEIGQREVASIRTRGIRQQSKLRKQAKRTKRAGRAALIKSITGAGAGAAGTGAF